MISFSNLLRKLATYAAAIVVFGLMLEVCARLDDLVSYGAPFFESYGSDRLRGEDEEGIRRNIPHGSYEKWHNNALGFRGPEIQLDRVPGVRRIVCLGASETYGLYESPDKEWPSQLSELLSDEEVEVVNAATVGLRRKDVLRYWEKYVARLKPDVVLLMPGPVTIRSIPGTPPPDSGRPDTRHFLQRFSWSPRLKAKAVQVVKDFIPRTLLESYQAHDRRAKMENAEQNNLEGADPLDDFAVASVEDFRRDWKRVIETIQACGTRVVLASTPTLLRPENLDRYELEFMEARRQRIKLSYEGLIRSYALSRLIMRELAAEFGLEFVDLYERIPADGKHYRDAVHFSDWGARQVAESFAAALPAMGLARGTAATAASGHGEGP